MNSLLKRQIRKYLDKDLQSNKNLELFLDAVNRSYHTSEDQFTMLQRATSLSSKELFEANSKLRKESESQKKIIKKLKNLIDTLKFYDLEEKQPLEHSDSLNLVEYIENKTKEIISINKQKDKLLASLEKQNQELSEYAHMVSHDLKSPLQSIEALTTWIKEDYSEVLDIEGQEHLELIRNNVEKMDSLLKSILEYSTIGKIENKIYNVDLEKLIKEIIFQIEVPKNIEIKVEKKLPIVKGDLYKLKILFSNLISNAIKFIKKDNGLITIGYLEKEHFWEFYIQDNGVGIEKKYLNKIFTAFKKLDNNNQSVGIGLSIVKKIIDIYQGNIWVDTKVNKGSTFYFTLKK